MIKRLIIALSALALLLGGSSVASEKYGWNPELGKKLFVAKIKKHICKGKLKITAFTQSHSQKEWREIIKNGQFEDTFIGLCPQYKKGVFTEEQVANLGDAAINYASDSYNIPS